MQFLIVPLLLFSVAASPAKGPEQCGAKPFTLGEAKPAPKAPQAAKPATPKAAAVKKPKVTKPLADCDKPANKG